MMQSHITSLATQFAEVDAKCWHAGDPWNGRGPGIEVEYLSEQVDFAPGAEDAYDSMLAPR